MSKTIFRDFRKTKTFKLPSSNTEIVLYEDLLGWQSNEVKLAKDEYQAGLITLKFIIKEWDFVDKEGNSVPIEPKILGRLPQKDLAFLFEEIVKAVRGSKKKPKLNLKK